MLSATLNLNLNKNQLEQPRYLVAYGFDDFEYNDYYYYGMNIKTLFIDILSFKKT